MLDQRHGICKGLGLACASMLGLGVIASCDSSASTGPESLRTVGVSELAASLDDGAVVVDVRDRTEFEAEHIPGATWLDPAALRVTIESVEGQVVQRPTAEAVFSEAGISPDDPVVVMGMDNGTDPARVAWTLLHFGHEGSVGLLDGGMQAWIDEGKDQVSDEPPRGTTGYLGRATRESLRVDQAWMLEHLGEGVAIFDVRTPEEYAEGHIPGAINVNWTNNLMRDGTFRDADEVRALHGDPADGTLVVYCRTGSRAAVSWALLRAAGYEDVRLYDGSWAEWGSDPDTPKE